MFRSFIKTLRTIMSTTFPIEDNTIVINFIDLSDQFFVSVIVKLSIKCFGYRIDWITWALIDQDLSSLLCFLLYRWEKTVISTILLESHNYGNSFLVGIIRLYVQPLDGIVVISRCWCFAVLLTIVTLVVLLIWVLGLLGLRLLFW